jgi:aminoglycoside phosphotransferase (APT) family kinase protein
MASAYTDAPPVSGALTRIARNGLPPAALRHLCSLITPGGRVVRVRPLRGGISSSVHLVILETAQGSREAVVVRRYGDYWLKTDPAACEREFTLLTHLAKINFPAPRPVLLDAEGGPFGAPTVVMSRLPGKPSCTPRHLSDYLRQMAEQLAALHRLPLDGLDFLPDQRPMVQRVLDRPLESDDPLQLAIGEAVRAEWADYPDSDDRRVLLHGDYWPGNLLWLRGRLVGVVDWEQPRLGEPMKDVASARGDLAVLYGPGAADAFTESYLAAGGLPLRHRRFWDLLISTWAVPEMPDWAVAYRVLGRPELTSAEATARIRAFAWAALSGDAE